MISTLLVANRGEIALRVMRTARRLGIRVVTAYTDVDRDAAYVREADAAIGLGADPRAWLQVSALRDALLRSSADAVHPGYGFLSENADFAEAVIDAGKLWVGPPPGAMRGLGEKAAARAVAATLGIPTVPGFDTRHASPDAIVAAADHIGYPILIKASAGGGGRGMRRVDHREALEPALAAAAREAFTAFGSDHLLLERYVDRPRHIEVQIFGDTHGNVVHLFERECSLQRRHQKVVEEAPSPFVDRQLRTKLTDAAIRFARSAGYVGAGTVEFLVEPDGRFYLLELNARLQVEHPVTEAITGLDLVEWQLRVAEGAPLPLTQDELTFHGHAIEVRLCAEDPGRDLLPAAGTIARLDLPSGDGVRVEAGYVAGDTVSPHYDSMLAKILVAGPDRTTAVRKLERALWNTWVVGLPNNLPMLRDIAGHHAFRTAELDTGFLPRHGLIRSPPWPAARGAVAATVYSWWQRRHHLPSGWRIDGHAWQTDAWRAGPTVVQTRWRAAGASVEIAVDGKQITVRPIETGPVWTVELDDGAKRVERWRFHAPASLTDGSTVAVHLGDAESLVQLEPRFPSHVAAAEPGSCVAPMPGRVTAVYVNPGDTVEKGARLVLLEAMKMEQAITAPEPGVVREVRCGAGQAVDAGAVLVVIDA